MNTMNAIRTAVSIHSFRIPPRLKLVLTRFGSLILLFQRMPVVQMLFPEANMLGSASLANSFALAVTTVVGLGAFDSVAGQSQISERAPLVVLGLDPAGTSPTAATAINVPATVSAPLTFSFNWDPINDFSSVKSWRCTTGGVVGTLPAGLSPAAVSPSSVAVGGNITISGTPTTAGTYPVKINVYRYVNGNSAGTGSAYSGTTAAQIFNICVLGFSTQPAATTSISSGSTATLTCVATGNPAAIPIVGSGPPAAQPAGTLTYQWYQGSSPSIATVAPGASTAATYITPALSSPTNYWVRIKSVLGTSTVTADSTTAAVTVATPPTVAVTPTGTLTNTSPITYTLTFSQSVTGLTTSGITVGNGTKGVLAGSGTTYTLPVTPTAQGAVTCQVNAGAASGNTVSNTASVTYDSVAPSVTINQAAAQADPTSASPINFTVVFSETVADFATGDVTIGGTSGGTKTATVTGSGTTYNVAVSGMTTAGTVIASLATGVAHDAAGNASAASASTDNTVAFTVSSPYDNWASGLTAGQSGPGQTPQNDGVTNLQKFAFNLNPLATDVRRLTVGGNGTAGLPGGAVVGGKLRLEFLRRIAGTNPGITYTAQFGSDLTGWTSLPVGTPAGTAIDATWERVVADDPTVGATKSFGRVQVLQTP